MLLVLYMIAHIIVLDRSMAETVTRTIGGYDAPPGKYSYVVRVDFEYSMGGRRHRSTMCAGSAMTPEWTLTAANCLSTLYTAYSQSANIPNLKPKRVVTYGNISALPKESDIVTEIISTILHPLYRLVKLSPGSRIQNDVGLIKTAPMKLKNYAKLCAADYRSLMGHAVVTAGYGFMFVGQTMVQIKSLQLLNVVLKECPDILRKQNILFPIMCLARPCGAKGALCARDNGAPLIHPAGIVGIASIGVLEDCTLKALKLGLDSHFVGLTTPVSPFLTWIADHINNDATEKYKRKINIIDNPTEKYY